MFELNTAVREALAKRERVFARASLSPTANARIQRALGEHAVRTPRPSPGLVLAAGLFLVGLMPWSSVQCQTPRFVPACAPEPVDAAERASSDSMNASRPAGESGRATTCSAQ